MLEKKEHIDDLFAGYLGDYEEKAPDYVWYNIQHDLKYARNKVRLNIIRAVAAAAALLVTFGLGYYYSDYSQEQIKSAYLPEKVNDNLDDSPGTSISSTDKSNKIKNNVYHINEAPIINQPEDDSNENNQLIFKLFRSSNEVFSTSSKFRSNAEKNASIKRTKSEKTTNQLLIDTLLFKKENLSERGFLLSEKKTGKSRWSFGTKFSPVYSMADNINQSDIKQNSPVLKSGKSVFTPDTKTDEKSMLAFSGGVNFNYYFAKRWSIESGLFYSQQRQMADNLVGSSIDGAVDEMQIYTPEGIHTVQQNGIVENNSPEVLGTAYNETYYSMDMEYMRNFDYIELPILVRYKVIDSRFGLDILSGMSTNILVGARTSLIYNNNDLWSGELEGISPMLYNATFGLGFNYNIYQNFSLNIEPTFKYSIFPDQTQTFYRYPYSFAVFAGFSFRF